MSFVLFEWSLDNLISEVESGITTLTNTLPLLDTSTPTDAVLRQQIFDLMTFYNADLTDYCGDLYSFMTELETATPLDPEALIDETNNPVPEGTLPFIPGFAIPPS